MFSKHSQSLKVLMMLTVSMTVNHLCQNLEIVKGVRSLKLRLLKVLISAINLPSHSVRRSLPLFGGGDHLHVSKWEKADRLPRPCS